MLNFLNGIFINIIKFLPYLVVPLVLTIIIGTPVFLLYIKYGYAVASLPVLAMMLGLYIYLHYYKKYTNIKILVWAITIIILIAVDLLIKFALHNENILQKSIQKKVEKHSGTTVVRNIDQFQNATIEEKILILSSAGVSKEGIKNKLKNDAEFRELTKEGDQLLTNILTEK